MYVHVLPSREGYDFNSEENIKKWSVLFINTLKEIQNKTHPFLRVKTEGLHYVVSLLLRLLNALLSPPTSSERLISSGAVLSCAIIEDRIQCLFPRPLKKRAICKAEETLAAFKNNKKLRANNFFNQNDRLPLKTPLDKFHQLLLKEIPGKIDIQVSQYVLAVLEFIASDILQLTGHYVRNMTHNEINSQDIRVAMCADKVLMDLFYNDVDEVAQGPPPSAGYHYHQSFFDSDITENEHSNLISVPYLEKVKELVHDERQFLRDLQMVIKVFREPLLRVLTPEEIEQFFFNIEDIYNFSHNFLFSLEEAYEAANEDEDPNIGSVFEDFAEEQEFDVFEKYANNLMSFSLRENLFKVLTPHESAFANEPGLYSALRHVLPQFLHVPVFHCFTYFKTIQNLKERTRNEEDRESFGQAEALLLPLKTELEKLTKTAKFNKSYMLRPCDRTNRATSLAKMAEIQRSIDGWQGKDIGQSCNEFILEGQLMKVSAGQHRSRRLTDRHAFLFDSLIVLCKPNTKRTSISVTAAVTGRDTSATSCDWRLKERYLIRNIEINDCDELSANGSHSGQSNGDHYSNSSLYSNEPQSFTSLTSSIVNLSIPGGGSINLPLFDGNNQTCSNFRNSFTIVPRNESPITLVAKSSEEKDQWISQLILLNTRPMLERTLDGKLQEEAKKHPLQLPNPNQYRFAVEDDETNIILEENKGDSNVPFIKGATLLKLIERLTYHVYGDPIFVRNFLTTYRSFCTPTDLLKLMIERFEIPEPDFKSCMQAMHFANEELSSPTSIHPPPEAIAIGTGNGINSNSDENGNNDCNDRNPTSPTNCSAPSLLSSSLSSFNGDPFDESNEQLQKDYREMLKRFRKEYAQPVQYRVVNVLRHWIDNHYYDFERDPQLLQDLTDFLNSKRPKTTPLTKNMRKMLEHCLKVLERKADQCEEVREFVQTQLPPPIEWNITKKEEEFNILTLHPVELARQLTLLEFDLYRAVKPSELVGTEGKSGIWTKKDKQKTSPNLVKMTKHNTNFIRYLEKCIVETENFEERVAVVVRIIEVMMVLQELNNFNGVFEVHSALKSASCHRLEHTLAALDKREYSKHKKALDEAQELIHDHSKKYIEKLKSINPPCVPFFGTYLSNILKIEEGNKEYLSTPSHLENMSLHESSGELSEEVVSAKLINFSKKTKVASITGEIQQYQDTPYSHRVEPTIRHWLENLDPIGGKSENEFEIYLYNKSLEIEPRGAKQPTKAPPKYPTKYLKSPGIKPARARFNISIDPLISNTAHKDSSSNAASSSSLSGSVFHHPNNTPNSAPNASESPLSPSTPLTPPQSAHSHLNESIFAPVMIGASNSLSCRAPSASPVSTPNHYNGQYSSQRFFPSHSQTLPTAPPPPPYVPDSSPIGLSNLADLRTPPPLPPRPRSFFVKPRPPASEEGSEADTPPPLPPRTYKPSSSQSGGPPRSGGSTGSRDFSSFPLSPHVNEFITSPGASSSSNGQLPYIHQRFSSDNILNSANIGSSSTLVRRNSANLEPLPPRRFSANPPPPPLPPMPSSPLHTPVTPPSSGGLATTPLESGSGSLTEVPGSLSIYSSQGPQLPPKTYRQTNAN